MKVLQVIQFFSPSFGGSVMIPYHLSEWLAKKGHDVTIITTDYLFDPVFARSLHDVEVIPFKMVVNVGMFLYSPSMKQWLKENLQKFDIVHLHNFRTYQNTILLKYAQRYGIPVILQPHGSLPRITEKVGLKHLYDIVWGNTIVKHAKTIVAVSQTEVEQFKEAGVPDEKITIIPNGIRYVSPIDLPPAGSFREHYNIHEKHIILYVGRIHKIKGIDFLIRAFGLFLQTRNGDGVILVIIGPDDGYRSVLDNLVEQLDLTDKVRFIGFMSPLEAAYQDADILVYPSSYEIFGLVPFEALLCGTPVIVTDDCGCGEIIREVECGYLVKYGDVAGLAKMIRYALEHPEENRKMVETGQEFIKDKLLWEKVVTQVEEIYGEYTTNNYINSDALLVP